MPPAEFTAFGGRYALMTSAYVFLAVLVLRTAAARLYAGAVLAAIGDQRVAIERLAPFEQQALRSFGLIDTAGTLHGPVGGGGKRTFRRRIALLAGVFAMMALWIGVAVQVFFGQFLNYFWIAWLNHPLLQLPWFPRVF